MWFIMKLCFGVLLWLYYRMYFSINCFMFKIGICWGMRFKDDGYHGFVYSSTSRDYSTEYRSRYTWTVHALFCFWLLFLLLNVTCPCKNCNIWNIIWFAHWSNEHGNANFCLSWANWQEVFQVLHNIGVNYTQLTCPSSLNIK